jgi:2-polyprenyl-3-methyl-5-hydroxy-6-metoxy-1,4-benzoquinol methylase
MKKMINNHLKWTMLGQRFQQDSNDSGKFQKVEPFFYDSSGHLIKLAKSNKIKTPYIHDKHRYAEKRFQELSILSILNCLFCDIACKVSLAAQHLH